MNKHTIIQKLCIYKSISHRIIRDIFYRFISYPNYINGHKRLRNSVPVEKSYYKFYVKFFEIFEIHTLQSD